MACECQCSSNIFKIQKRALRITTNKNKRESCRPLYNQLQILTLPSQYIFSLLMFVVKNKDLFMLNLEIHTFNTRNNSNLYMPNTNLTIFQKGALYSGCKIYNKLPSHIKSLSNDLKRFKSTLKGFLMECTLYSIDEFYQITWNDNDSYQCYDLCILYPVTYTISGIQIAWNDYDSYQCWDLCILYTVIYTIFTHILWLIPCL